MNETLFRIHLVAKGLKISDIERDLVYRGHLSTSG